MYRDELEHEARLIARGQQLFVASLAARWRAFCRLVRLRVASHRDQDPPHTLMI